MSKTVFSIVFICSMLLLSHPAAAPAQSQNNNNLEKMKTGIYRFGTGEKAKVVVRLKNGSKLKGFIRETGDESFSLTDSRTKQTTAVAYQDIAEVKKQGWSTATKFALGVGIGVAVTVAVLAIVVGNSADNIFDDTVFLRP